jgi:type I restriction enzyme M protein
MLSNSQQAEDDRLFPQSNMVDAEAESEDTATALAENQLYDFITNAPVKDTPTERLFQAVARALVDEYGFEHTQLVRDQSLVYETFDMDGKLRKQRTRISIAVFPENVRKDDPALVSRVCIVQDAKVRASDPKRGVMQLEETLGALPNCRYGMWTNGSEQVYKQKLTGGGRIQPEYVDLYDLPGNYEEAKDLDDPERAAVRIATGDNLQRTFARIHDYIYGNQGLKKDAAFWQVLNLIFCKIHDERSKGQAALLGARHRTQHAGRPGRDCPTHPRPVCRGEVRAGVRQYLQRARHHRPQRPRAGLCGG